MNDEKKKQTLKVEDLMRLFGEVRQDDGRPFIFAEGADNFDEEEPEHLRYVNMEEDDEDAEMGNEE